MILSLNIKQLFFDVNNLCRHFSVLLVQTICRMILPKSLGGNEIEVLFLNLDHRVKRIDFVETLNQFLSTKATLNVSTKRQIVESSLHRLWIMDIFDWESYEICPFKIVDILSSNRLISLLAVDSLSAFFNFCRLQAPGQSLYFDRFIQQEVQRFTFRQFDIQLIYCKQVILSTLSRMIPFYIGSEVLLHGLAFQ